MVTLSKNLLEQIMSKESSKILVRQWKVIQFLLSTNTYVTTTEVEEHLNEQGIETSQRTIQRDLNLLEKIFPLECRRDCMPYNWRWKYTQSNVKELNLGQAVILRLVDEELRNILPEHIMHEIAPLFDKARQVTLGKNHEDKKKSLMDIFNRRSGKFGQPHLIEPDIIRELVISIGEKTSDIYRNALNLDVKQAKSILEELAIILESHELPELAQALKN